MMKILIVASILALVVSTNAQTPPDCEAKGYVTCGVKCHIENAPILCVDNTTCVLDAEEATDEDTVADYCVDPSNACNGTFCDGLEACIDGICIVPDGEVCGSTVCEQYTELCFLSTCYPASNLTKCDNTYCFSETQYCSETEICLEKTDYILCGSTYCATALLEPEACKNSTSCVVIREQCASYANDGELCRDSSKWDDGTIQQGSAEDLCNTTDCSSGWSTMGPFNSILFAIVGSFLFVSSF